VPDDHRGSNSNLPVWGEGLVTALLMIGGTPANEAVRLWGAGSKAILDHIERHPGDAYSEWLIKECKSRVTVPTANSRHLFP
jgi:hypothetical protein